MDSLQKQFESMFCPPLDSALVAAIVSDENNVNECFNILSSLAEEANSFLDAERENFGESEFSENCSSNYKSSTSERDSGENGNESITSIEYQTDSPYIVDDFDSESICLTGDEIPLDEKIERLNFIQNEVEQSSPESPKEFLKACFPTFSENKIDVLLQEHDNNAETVSDIILNELCLAEQKNCVYYDSFPLTPPISERDEDNFLVSDSRSKHRKKKRHRKPKQGVIIFQNNALRPNSMPSSNPSSLSPQMSFSPSPQMSSSSSSVNSWPPLPIPKTPPDNYWKTVGKNRNSILNFNGEQEIFDINLSKLVNIFPDHEFQDLKNALMTADGEIHNAVGLLLKTSDINENNGKSLNQTQSNRGNGRRTSHDLFLSDSAILNFETRQYQDTQKKSNIPVNSRNYAKSTSATTFHTSKSLSSSYTNTLEDDNDLEDDDDDPNYCRQQARECMKKRNEAFKKAANAFQKSKGSRNGEGGIAFHYSTEGRNFDAEMKKWNLRAARSIVKRQSKRNGDANLLDLHGLSVDEALVVVKERLDEWYPREMIRYGQTPSRPLKIVTGLGNHSPNGVGRLRTEVKRSLIKDNWDISEYKGYVMVKGVKN